MRKFFGIEKEKYIFEWGDISTLLTIANVLLIILGFWWAPLIGIVNCGLALVLGAKSHAHINMWVMQIALVVLNCYFLTL
jgi:hypothetical protein